MSISIDTLLAEVRRALVAPPTPMSEAVRDIVVRVMRGYPELDEAARELGNRGWTLPMWATQEFIADALEALRVGDVDQFLTQAYLERDGEREADLLKDVTSHRELERWAPLLQECVAGYQSGLYRLVVPSLLLVLDGLLGVAGEGVIKTTDPKAIASQRRKIADRPRVDWLAWLSVETFVSAVFGNRPYRMERPILLNRHWVLHGRDVPEWNRTDCLRLMQAIETVCTVLEIFRDVKDAG